MQKIITILRNYIKDHQDEALMLVVLVLLLISGMATN